ncbi:MAG: stage III sporulation protein AD [Anaerovoracaceae bacterium]
MEILKIAAIAISGVILAALMKNINKDVSMYVVLATVIVIFVMILDKLTMVFQFLSTIYDDMTYGKEFFPIIIKVLVVAYMSDFTAQICKDAGEGAIGSKVELGGKIIIFYLAMPIILSILELINSIL